MMRQSKIDTEKAYAKWWGLHLDGKPRMSVNWSVFKGCWLPPTCAVRGLCWAKEVSRQWDKDFDEFGFMPRFYREKLFEPRDEHIPRHVLVGWQGEIGALDSTQIAAIIQEMEIAKHHRYFILTKQPAKLQSFKFPPHCHVGVSICTAADIRTRMPYVMDRSIKCGGYFVYLEPLMGPAKDWVHAVGASMQLFAEAERVVIGSYSGMTRDKDGQLIFPKGMPKTHPETLETMTAYARTGDCLVQWKHNIWEVAKDAQLDIPQDIPMPPKKEKP